jgi:thiol-disulfide isomerase/thioredoxin
MGAKLALHLFVLLFSMRLLAQEVTVALSQYPNKQAIIVAVHGVRKDTLGTVLLDKNGKGTLAYTTKHPLAGLVNLTIKDKEHLSFDFVLSPNENPLISSDGEYVYAQNTKILNSPENDCLNRWFDALAQYKQKISLNQELSKLYQPKTAFLKLLEIEKQTSEEQLQKLTDTINNSRLFAAKYIQFKMAQEEKLAKVWESNEERTKAKNYFTQIDFDALYGTSMWFTIINSCIEAYVKEGAYYQTFGTDVVRNLKRIKNQQVYEDFVDATISVTEKFSWNIDQDAIVDFIIEDNRIKKPTLKLQKIIEAHNLTNGKKVPDLFITNPFETNSKTTVLKTSDLKSKYNLLLFYQSDCGHCKTVIEGLKENYQDLVQKGVKIISIAGDTNQETFKTTAAEFPWANACCDVNGMNGINFKNYAVLGTPTIYVLDSKGIILSKTATISEVLEFINLQG